MTDIPDLTVTVESASIDLLEQELVVEVAGPKSTTEARTPLELSSSAEADYTVPVPIDSIDAEGAREHLAGKHRVPRDDILISKIEAPNKVHYDVAGGED